MNVSVKRVKNKSALERAIEDATVEGWKLNTRSDTTAVMKKSGGVGSALGHLILLLLTAWWTFFLGNIAYAAYKYVSGSQELRIKID